MGKRVKLNGVDFTSYFTPWGYTVSHKKVQGGNQGTMRDGSFTDDVLAYKAVIALTCMPLTEAQLEMLSGTLYADDYVTLSFYDPRKKMYRSADCTFTVTPARERGVGADGLVRWTGAAINLEER